MPTGILSIVNGKSRTVMQASQTGSTLCFDPDWFTCFNVYRTRVEYSLTEKGVSVVPILQSICQWSGAYHKEESENTLLQCQKCDYK